MNAAGSLAALHHQMSGPGSGKDIHSCVVSFVNLRDVSTFWCVWLTLAWLLQEKLPPQPNQEQIAQAQVLLLVNALIIMSAHKVHSRTLWMSVHMLPMAVQQLLAVKRRYWCCWLPKLQSNVSSCFADCAEEYERQVPKLRQQTLQQLRQSRQSGGYWGTEASSYTV